MKKILIFITFLLCGMLTKAQESNYFTDLATGKVACEEWIPQYEKLRVLISEDYPNSSALRNVRFYTFFFKIYVEIIFQGSETPYVYGPWSTKEAQILVDYYYNAPSKGRWFHSQVKNRTPSPCKFE